MKSRKKTPVITCAGESVPKSSPLFIVERIKIDEIINIKRKPLIMSFFMTNGIFYGFAFLSHSLQYL
jgi:hypothetical protein